MGARWGLGPGWNGWRGSASRQLKSGGVLISHLSTVRHNCTPLVNHTYETDKLNRRLSDAKMISIQMYQPLSEQDRVPKNEKHARIRLTSQEILPRLSFRNAKVSPAVDHLFPLLFSLRPLSFVPVLVSECGLPPPLNSPPRPFSLPITPFIPPNPSPHPPPTKPPTQYQSPQPLT